MCDDCDWEGALDEIDEALDDINELPDRAADFAESVEEKLRGIDQWITNASHVTDAQMEAIENIRDGIDKWMER